MAMGTDIFEKIDVHLQNHRMGIWTGTFRDYLGMVIKQPSLAQRAHARLYTMIKHTGVQVDDEGKEHYAFFEHDLFGIDEPLARVVEYFKAAAMGSDVGRRILLLYGPPLSGKSQLVILLKRGLEAYTQTEEAAVYAIADCPQHEDPLNLMPHPLRQDFRPKPVCTSRASCARSVRCICVSNTRVTFIACPSSASFSRKKNGWGLARSCRPTPNPRTFPNWSAASTCPRWGTMGRSRIRGPIALTVSSMWRIVA